MFIVAVTLIDIILAVLHIITIRQAAGVIAILLWCFFLWSVNLRYDEDYVVFAKVFFGIIYIFFGFLAVIKVIL